MAGAMFLQQRLNPTSPDPVQAKVMMFMPIAMSALFMFLPSGLVLYYVTNTAWACCSSGTSTAASPWPLPARR